MTEAPKVEQVDIEIGQAVYRDFLLGISNDAGGKYEGEECAIHAASRARLATLSGETERTAALREAHKACDRFFREAMPQINIGASAMDANAIDAWNMAEVKTARARAALQSETNDG